MKNSLLEVVEELDEKGATTRKGELIDFANIKYRTCTNKRLTPLLADLLIFAIKQHDLSVQRSLIKVTIGEKNAWQITKMDDEQIQNIYPSLSSSQKSVVRQIRRSAA